MHLSVLFLFVFAAFPFSSVPVRFPVRHLNAGASEMAAMRKVREGPSNVVVQPLKPQRLTGVCP